MSSPAANAARVYGINTMRHLATRSCCAPARLMMQQRFRPTCTSSPAANSRGSSCLRERGRLRHSTRSTQFGRQRASPAGASSPQAKLRPLPMIRVQFGLQSWDLENRVGYRLATGGSRIRTCRPPSRLVPLALDPTTGNLRGVSRNGRFVRAGLMVRIRLPPAESQWRTWPSRPLHGRADGDDGALSGRGPSPRAYRDETDTAVTPIGACP